MREFQYIVNRYLMNRENQKKYLAVLLALSVLVSFVVPLILMQPADSMTRNNAVLSTQLSNADGTIRVPVKNVAPNSEGTKGANGNIIEDTNTIYSPAEADLITLIFGTGAGLEWADQAETIADAMEEAKTHYFLGLASDFCAFIEGDFTATEADAEGRMAVGGNLTFTKDWNYQIGSGDYASMTPLIETDNYIGITGFAHALVGGSMYRINTLSTGRGHYLTDSDGSNDRSDKDVGYHSANSDSEYSYTVFFLPEEGLYKRFVVGDVAGSQHYDDILQTDISYGSACQHDYPGDCGAGCQHGYLASVNELAQIYESPEVSVKDIISSAFATVRNRSANLAKQEGIRPASAEKEKEILFVGPGANSNVKTVYFTVDEWMDYRTIKFTDIPADANIVVNVPGDKIALGGFTEYKTDNKDETNIGNIETWLNGTRISNTVQDGPLTDNNKEESERILYNFYAASKVEINGNFNGTVLAPNADVGSYDVECPGHLSGALIAKSFYGGLEFGYRPYRGGSEILGLTSGYAVPVDKLIAGSKTMLSGASLALMKADTNEKIFSWISNNETRYVPIASQIDFSGGYSDSPGETPDENPEGTPDENPEDTSGVLAYAYFNGNLGATSHWGLAGNPTAVRITGDGTYTVKWDLPNKNVTVGENNQDAFGIFIEAPTGVENFTSNTYSDLAIEDIKVLIDGEELSDYTSENALNMSDGTKTTIKLYEDWGIKVIPEYTVVNESIEVIFTITGTNVTPPSEGTDNENFDDTDTDEGDDPNGENGDDLNGENGDDPNGENGDDLNGENGDDLNGENGDDPNGENGEPDEPADPPTHREFKETYKIVEEQAPEGFFKSNAYYEVVVTELLDLTTIIENGDGKHFPADVETKIEITKVDDEIRGETKTLWFRLHDTYGDYGVESRTITVLNADGTDSDVVYKMDIDALEQNVTALYRGEVTIDGEGDSTTEFKSLVEENPEFNPDIVQIIDSKYYFDPESMMIMPMPESNLEFENTPGLLFKKVDELGQAVAGATIQLLKDETQITGDNLWTWDASTSSQLIDVSKLDEGDVYTFHEEDPPKKHQPADDIYFSKVNDTEIKYWTKEDKSDEQALNLLEDREIKMVDERILGAKLSLKKIDYDSKEKLEDAVFSLYAVGNPEPIVSELNGNGNIFDNENFKALNNKYVSNGYLRPGTYYLIEDTMPEHKDYDSKGDTYEKPGKIWFRVNNDFTITNLGADIENGGSSGEITDYEILELKIKTDEHHIWLLDADGKELDDYPSPKGCIPNVISFKLVTNGVFQQFYATGGISDESKNVTEVSHRYESPIDLNNCKIQSWDPALPSLVSAEVETSDGKKYVYPYSVPADNPTELRMKKQLTSWGAWEHWVIAPDGTAMDGNSTNGIANVTNVKVSMDKTISQYWFTDRGTDSYNKTDTIEETYETPVTLNQVKFYASDENINFNIEITTSDGTVYTYPYVAPAALAEGDDAANTEGGDAGNEETEPTEPSILQVSTNVVSGQTITNLQIANKADDGLTDIKVEKAWVGDGGFESVTRPEFVTVKLYQSTEEITDRTKLTDDMIVKDADDEPITETTAELKSSNNWAATFKDLPSRYTGDDGKYHPYYYYIKEVEVPTGYFDSYSTAADGALVVTNTLDSISINAVKHWDTTVFGEDGDAYIPDSVVVKLQWLVEKEVDGVPKEVWEDVPNRTLTLKNPHIAGNTIFTGEFKDLPKGYTYQIVEPFSPSGWEIGTLSNILEKVDKSGETLEITNRPDLGSISIQKNWLGDEDKTEKRPDEIYVQLYRKARKLWPDGQPTESVKDDNGNITELGVIDDYARLLQYSLYFYDGVMCGSGVGENSAYHWRDDCHCFDGVTPGGFHDAGDHVMFGLPSGFSASNLGWSLYEFRDQYDILGQTAHTKVITDYYAEFFMDCVKLNGNGDVESILVQKGHGNTDHAYWGVPEGQPAEKYYDTGEENVDDTVTEYWRSDTGADIAAEYAAALALSYLNFHETDEAKYGEYLAMAKKLYAYADKVKGNPSKDQVKSDTDEGKTIYGCLNEWGVNLDEIQKGEKYPGFYKSDDYKDDMAWAAAWIAVASYEANTDDATYYDNACQSLLNGENGQLYDWGGYHWNNVKYGAMIANAAYLGGSWDGVASFVKDNCAGGGYKNTNEWGESRYNSGYQTIGLMAAKYQKEAEKNSGSIGIDAAAVAAWAKSQMDFILGKNDYDTCFITNFAENSVKKPHYRAGSGQVFNMQVKDDTSVIDSYEYDKNRLIGGLVGGPQGNGKTYDDVRSDFQLNEVASDYNANLVGAAAGLYYFYGTGSTYEIPGVKKQYLAVAAESESSLTAQSVLNNQTSRKLNLSSLWSAGLAKAGTLVDNSIQNVKLDSQKDFYFNLQDITSIEVDYSFDSANGGSGFNFTLNNDWSNWMLQPGQGNGQWNEAGGYYTFTKNFDNPMNITQITAQFPWGANSATLIEVRFYSKQASMFKVTPQSSTIFTGESTSLTFSGATEPITWTIPEGSGITINGNILTAGTATGEFKIMGVDSANKTGEFTINVDTFRITSATEFNIPEGSTDTYTLTANADALWSVNSDYVTLSAENGREITFNVNGYTTDEIIITAEYNGKQATATIHMTAGELELLDADKIINVHVGKTTTIPLNFTDSSVEITGIDTTYATIDGLTITGVKLGETDFTATRGQSSVNGKINVIPDISIQADEGDEIMNLGDTIQLTAENTVGRVEWGTSDSKIAVVDQNGNVTATGFGVVTITATDADGTFDTHEIRVQVSGIKAVLPDDAELVNEKITLRRDQNWAAAIDQLQFIDENGDFYYYYIVEIDGESLKPIEGTSVITGKGATYVPVQYVNGLELRQDPTQSQLSVSNQMAEEFEAPIEMPSAGGEGTTWYYIAGAAMMLAGIAGYFVLKRKQSSER